MKEEIIKRLSRKDLPQDSGVLVTTHVPFIISGKYCDYKEGEMVSTTIEELHVTTLANKYKEDMVRIYLNDHCYDYQLSTLEVTEEHRGTLKAIVFGIFNELLSRKILKVFEGLVINVDTNLNMMNGFQLNYIANILLSVSHLYNLKLTPSVLADLTQKVYIMYYGKTVSYLQCLTLFNDGINRYEMAQDNIKLEHLEKTDETFRYLMFENGNRMRVNDYNNFYSSMYQLFKKVKGILGIGYLSEIRYNRDFAQLFSPLSHLLEPEKLVLTHYIEENKRAKIIFSVYKHQNNPRQLIDAVNMSTTELGAYCGFNNLNKWLETTVYNGALGFPCCVTHLNDEITNMFVFTTTNEFYEPLVRQLNKYHNYFFYEVHPAAEASEITMLETAKETKAREKKEAKDKKEAEKAAEEQAKLDAIKAKEDAKAQKKADKEAKKAAKKAKKNK